MDRHALVFPRRFALSLLLAGLAWIVITGCHIADPALPSFSTNLTIPLGEKRIDIQDIIEDENYLDSLQDGIMAFWVSGDPDTVSLDFNLGVDIPMQQVSSALGAFTLDIDAGVNVAFTLVHLYQEAAYVDGQTVPVPAFHFSVESTPEDVQDLESADLSAGTLTVMVSNGLPVPISSSEEDDDQLVLEILDPNTDQVLLDMVFDLIAPEEQAQRTVDLAGIRLPGHIAVRLVGGSPGSGAASVLVDAQTTIGVETVFNDLQVVEAVAVIPPQAFDTNFESPLPADYGVALAVIETGTLAVFLRNEMAIPCQAMVTWPAVSFDGQVLQLTIDLAGGSQQTRHIDFSNHVVQAPDGETLTHLVATVAITSPGSDGQQAALAADQGLEVEIGSGRFEFASVTGTVPALSYELEPMEKEIALPDGLDGLLLCRARMVLELTSTAGLPATAFFHLAGINQTGSRHEMLVQEEIQPAEEGRSTTTTIILDETNSTIVAFLNHMPTMITLAGSVDVGGGGDDQGTVRRGDYAVVNWHITAPVEVIIENAQLYSEAQALDLSQDARDMIEDHAGAAEIQLVIMNHLPVGVQTRLLLGTDTDVIKTEPLLAIGPIVVDAGIIAPARSIVVEPLMSRPTLYLTAAETKLLAAAGMQSMLEVTLPGTEGDTVRVMNTDYVSVQGYIHLDIEVHDNR